MSLNKEKPPVITIDGPSGSGKGTVSQLIANQLKWNYLDSGALYRALAIVVQKKHVDPADETKLAELAAHLRARFLISDKADYKLVLDGQDISEAIRSETCSALASKVSAFLKVREALLANQRSYRQWPGLVTDGRDMGTIVFPDAELKIFLTASAEERALRRYNQLKEKGNDVSLGEILSELVARDKRDTERTVAPLVPAQEAIIIDTTGWSVDHVMALVREQAKVRFNLFS